MEAILSWIKLPRNLAWPLVIVCALLLWGSDEFKAGLGLQPFIDNYREWIGIVFLFFLVLGLQPIVSFIYTKITDKIEQQKKRETAEARIQTEIKEEEARKIAQLKEAEKNIRGLTGDEKAILIYFLQNNTRTQDLDYQNGNVTRLTNLGFVCRASNVSYGGRRGSFTFPYNISDWAWGYIQENPEVLN